MKQLILKLIIPLTIISFATITKWWHTLPVDAPDTLFAGFPFPFVCEGWHTSMSLQIFVMEFLADLLTYFSIWLIVIFCIHRFWIQLKPTKIITLFLWTMTGLIITAGALIAFQPNNLFYFRRTFDMEIMETGYRVIWQKTEHPHEDQYHPQDEPQ